MYIVHTLEKICIYIRVNAARIGQIVFSDLKENIFLETPVKQKSKENLERVTRFSQEG